MAGTRVPLDHLKPAGGTLACMVTRSAGDSPLMSLAWLAEPDVTGLAAALSRAAWWAAFWFARFVALVWAASSCLALAWKAACAALRLVARAAFLEAFVPVMTADS